MILEFVMNILKTFLLFIIGLFPAIPSMSWASTSITPVIKVLSGLNYFIDIKVFGACLVFMFLLHNIDFIWSIIMWVIRKIPGVS